MTIEVTDELLRQWPLPDPSAAADKEDRGSVLIIAGSREIPGGAVLAALAAMRAGAGKLTVVTAEAAAQTVALSLPEARVIPMRDTRKGGFRCDLDGLPLDAVDAVLIGPGMQHESATANTVHEILETCPSTPIVLDALAMNALMGCEESDLAGHRLVMTPHPGELASLLEVSRDEIEADGLTAAFTAAARWNAVVVAKSGTTHVVTPARKSWTHRGGCVGLATSGSGDVLAGIVTGLCARGAVIEQAAVWGVRVHALAGESLEKEIGTVGFLARELPAQIPSLLDRLNRIAR